MIHPNTELRFISPEVGYGVVAKSFIPKGTIIWALDDLDRTFTIDEINAFDPPYKEIFETYCYRNNKGEYVLCWDHARFVNHSFNSNCLTTAYDFEIAIKDIQPGEQLTDDYGYLNIETPFRGIDEGTRRKVVYPHDLLKHYKTWDKKIAEVFPLILEVEQPLQKILKKDNWNNTVEIIRSKKSIDSILTCYYATAKSEPLIKKMNV